MSIDAFLNALMLSILIAALLAFLAVLIGRMKK